MERPRSPLTAAPFTAADVRAVEAVVARATAADGAAPLSEQGIRVLTADVQSSRFLVTVPTAAGVDEIVGVAVVLPGEGERTGEVVVDPDHRGRGVGTAAVRQLLDQVPRVWAHGDLPAAQRVASKLALVSVRELVQMRRPTVDDLPPVPAREDVVVRAYRPGDDAEILRVNNLAFAWHPEQGGWTQRDLDLRFAEPWFDPAGLFVAESTDGSGLSGFHWTKVHQPDPDAGEQHRLGEVYVVAVDPVAHGRGLGSLLTLVGLHYLREVGPAVLLYVEADNTAAVQTYRGLGFTRFHTDMVYARP